MRMDQVIFISSAEVDIAGSREDTFMGEDFFVIPVVAIVEGVLHAANAPSGPELALEESNQRRECPCRTALHVAEASPQ